MDPTASGTASSGCQAPNYWGRTVTGLPLVKGQPLLDPLCGQGQNYGAVGPHSADGDQISEGVTLCPVHGWCSVTRSSPHHYCCWWGGVCKGLAGRSQGRREQQWRPEEELFLGVGDTWCGEVLSRITSAALSVQGPSGASALGAGRPTPQGCLETSQLPWPSGPQRALQNSLGGSGWLSSAGCVMTRPGFAVLTARSSSSDCSLSSTEVRLRV